ncbi:MAG: GNAT family N-acetyltransferase [Bacteroidales bacterium]|jgi:predicted GNAT family N-acyltransferase|nr:GNAT family N-acetyltransferase [Bacteroidales bacterium]MDD4213433.1 GNAT family N-acetyltransferase [Bacteroidales bacterium]
MIRIVSFSFSNHDLFKQSFAIRQAVFVKEQGVPEELEHDEHEKTVSHYLALYNNIPVGTARWRKTEQGIKLERFAVLPEYRNKGIGDALVKKVLEDVVPFNKLVYLHSQLPACNLYKRAGFEIAGDVFYEAGMAHCKMVLKS